MKSEPPSEDPVRSEANTDEGVLHALLRRLAAQAAPSAQLPSLSELAALMPERLSWQRLNALRLLSAQQRMVLGQLGEGMANKAIAHRMGVTEKTIEYHCDIVRKRLGIKERTELAAFAGLLSATRDSY